MTKTLETQPEENGLSFVRNESRFLGREFMQIMLKHRIIFT